MSDFHARANKLAPTRSTSVFLAQAEDETAYHQARIDGASGCVFGHADTHDPAAVTATCERVLAAWAALHGKEVKP